MVRNARATVVRISRRPAVGGITYVSVTASLYNEALGTQQFPVRCSQFPVLVPGSQFSVLGSQVRVHRSGFTVPCGWIVRTPLGAFRVQMVR
jgi:hypothetical protein